jgi:signal transduction histidine kinase/CheY-like chemotaxis protein
LAFQPLIGKSINIDSLELASHELIGIEKAKTNLQLAQVFSNNHPDSSIEYANKALEIAKQEGDKKIEASSLHMIANGYRLTGNNVNSLEFLLSALQIYKGLDDVEGIAHVSDDIGRIYRFLGNYSLALDYHLDALAIFKNLKDKHGIASSLINTGIVYRNLGNTNKALENYNKALSICREINDQETIVSALISIGNVYWYDGDNNNALTFYEEALMISSQPGFSGDHTGGILNNIGNVNRSIKNYDKALGYYNQSLKITTELGDKNLIAVSYKNIGITYREMGDYAKAIQFLKDGYQLAEEIQLIRVMEESLNYLSYSYYELNNYRKAFDYFEAYTKLKDSLFDKKENEKITILQLNHEMKEREQAEKLNEKDFELENIKLRNTRNYIIFLFIIVFLIALFIWSRYRNNAKANEELRMLNVDLERRVEERTKRMREENEHRRIAQEQAELANEAKNRFLATISHEVRTPINAIIGFCDLTFDDDIDDKHKINLKRVKDSSEHLLALIKDVLDYSQIESGMLELKELSFSLNELIESVVNAYYLDAESKKINLSFEIAGNIPTFVIGDPGSMRQILYNLIGNAIKFTDKGEVAVSVKQKGNVTEKGILKLEISVKDTGIGISKLKQKLIFKDFTQADSSSSRRYGGAGLGLTLSKHFVEMMNGSIFVESEKGKGSTFTINVQLKVDTQKSVKKVLKKPPTKSSLHILVAEDNFLNAQVVKAFLERLGHTSEVANNGLEAVEMLEKKDFDAVLMDIEMPEMDGLEATRVIRAGKGRVKDSDVTIIALTAHALKKYEEASFAAGMNGYLTKPVDIDQLKETLKAI